MVFLVSNGFQVSLFLLLPMHFTHPDVVWCDSGGIFLAVGITGGFGYRNSNHQYVDMTCVS